MVLPQSLRKGAVLSLELIHLGYRLIYGIVSTYHNLAFEDVGKGAATGMHTHKSDDELPPPNWIRYDLKPKT